MRWIFAIMVLSIITLGCASVMDESSPKDTKGLEKATLAGGCFWCMEHPFEELDGVVEVLSGYSGGEEESPTYEEVSSGKTGHVESVQIIYDPKKVSYKKILDIFWRQVNPTDDEGQFVDRGKQYTTAIFYHNEEQKKIAEESKKALEESGKFDKPIVTIIEKFTAFYPAEEYHQDYATKNPVRYKTYRFLSGRDKYLEEVWEEESSDMPSKEELKKKLTPLQYKVTQENGTEPAYDNEYVDNKKEGIYVDVVSGEPLFSSKDKYDSKTGWPSFTKPLESENIVENEDRKFLIKRTELRSKEADSHLGHVFADGPEHSGLRYCINSAAMRFIPKEDLEKEGYGEYLELFD